METQTPLEQLDKSENFEKYRTAGQIASKALDKVVQFTTPGVSVKSLCELGDEFIISEVQTVYSKKTYNKGIAFPTCIGINNCPGYYSPLDDSIKVSDGDLVNIELGVHIDGFPATVGYTVVVNTTGEPLRGQTARLMHAVSEASKEVLSKFKDGVNNKEVTKILRHSASKYNCNLVYVDDPYMRTPGLYSYQMSKNVIDGKNDDEDGDNVHQMLINREHNNYDFSLRNNDFEENEVYAVDIVMSTGSGKLYPTEERVTVFRRNYDEKYSLRLKASKHALSHFKGPFPTSCRDFMDSRLKLGVQECTKHRLLIPYGVFGTEPGHMVAKIKFTVIVKKKKAYLVAGRSSDEQLEKVSLIEKDEKEEKDEDEDKENSNNSDDGVSELDVLQESDSDSNTDSDKVEDGVKLETGEEIDETIDDTSDETGEEVDETGEEDAILKKENDSSSEESIDSSSEESIDSSSEESVDSHESVNSVEFQKALKSVQ